MQAHTADFHTSHQMASLVWQESEQGVVPVWTNLSSVPSTSLQLTLAAVKRNVVLRNVNAIELGRVACSNACAKHFGIILKDESTDLKLISLLK